MTTVARTTEGTAASVELSRLRPGDGFAGVFLLRRAELRRTKNGKDFLDLEILDRAGGSLAAKLWDATPEQHQALRAADVVLVEGEVEAFHERLQARVRAIRPAPAGQGVPTVADFLPRTEKDIRALYERLVEIVRSVENDHVRALCLDFIADPELRRRFVRAPAAVSNHHACVGGLLEHVVSLAEACLRIAALYPVLDRDLLVAGAVLHDIGKVEELGVARGFEYTDRGRLVGHIVIGVLWLEERARRIEGFPPELLDRLKHLILSHHGTRDCGSPVEPCTAEAIALHFLDNLDAKLWAFARATREAAESGATWTPYHRLFGRPLFAGERPAGPPSP